MRALLKLLLVLFVAAAALLAWTLLMPLDPGTRTVMLRPGASARRIAAELRQAGVIRSSTAFLLLHYWQPRPLKAGEYAFDSPATAREVYDRIARGDVVFHTVVVPEGFTLFDVATALESAGLASRSEVLQRAGDPALVADLDPSARSLEGYLYPDTYHFTRIQTVPDMLTVMVHRFRQESRSLGLGTNGSTAAAEAPPPGLNLHQLVTLASIVEKETSVPEERPMVAAVYYNRLRAGMPLDADPSVIYASLLAGRYNGAIRQSDLQLDSPYNTYRYPGLPPGPIANPGRASLDAALHPAAVDYLFFVSDGQGRHRFARTLAEHARNVAAYRKSTSR